MISIDLGSYETKIIEARVLKGSVSINKTCSFNTPINSYKDGYMKNIPELIDKTKEELKNNKIKSNGCFINIKSTAIITREIAFPLLEDNEIDGLLEYQLPEYLPTDPDKYIVQHRPLERITTEDNEKLKTLVIAIPKDIVDTHYSFIRDLGLKPLVMDYQNNTLWKLLKHAGRVNNEIDIKNKTIAVIDLGYDSTNITIIKNSIMQVSRVLDIGGFNMDSNLSNLIALEDEDVQTKKLEVKDLNINDDGYSDYNRMVNIINVSLESTMERIERVFRYFLSRDTGNEIENILLYGGLSNISGIDKLFSRYFNLPVSIINYLDKILIQHNLNKYINCIGGLLREDEVRYR